MLVDKLGAIIDLIVDYDEEILLGIVLRNILVSVGLRHFEAGGGLFGMKPLCRLK